MSQTLHVFHDSPEDDGGTSRRLKSTGLLLRGGYIQALGDGLFAYLPMGMKVIRNIAAHITRELRKLGGEEVLLPLVNPGELWETSGRDIMVSEEITWVEDKNNRLLVLAPMHEEASVECMRRSIRSVDQLPRFIYQFQGKFRDEVLSETGLLKAREFIMSDSYSFHRSYTELNNFIPKMFAAYKAIFTGLGLNMITAEGSANFAGASNSYDFLLGHPWGEDVLVHCPGCGYSANQDVAVARQEYHAGRPLEMERVNHKNCFDLACLRQSRGLPASRTAEARVFATLRGYVFAVYRSDRRVSPDKLAKVLNVPIITEMNETELEQMGFPAYVKPGRGRRKASDPAASPFLSPLLDSMPDLDNWEFSVAVDNSVAESANLIFSGGKPGNYIINVNFGRDFDADFSGDFTMVDAPARCYHCNTELELSSSIKIASIYRIGEFYSRKFGFLLKDRQGEDVYPSMGAYGFGLGRLMASLVEAHAYKDGYIWPMNISPYKAVLIIVGRSATIQEIGNKIHSRLGPEILLDDRKIPVIRKFRDLDRTGIPVRMIISGQTLDDGKLMICHRRLCPPQRVQLNHVEAKLRELEDLEQERFSQGKLFPEEE